MGRSGIAFLALSACAGSSTVQQAGVVPPVRPMAYDGQPLGGGARVEGRLSSVLTDVSAEEEGENSGLYVAREVSSVALRGGYRWFDAGIELDLAWVAGSQATREGLLARPDADTAIGVMFPVRFSADLGSGMRLGAGLSWGVWSIPVNVNGDTERDEAGAISFALVPSYRTGNLAVFAGLTLASEIDVPGALVIEDSFDAPEAQSDGGAVLMSAGGSLFFDSGLKLTAQIGSAAASAISTYGLQVDLLIGFEWGEQKEPQVNLPWERKRPPPPQPSYPYPPPQPYPQPAPQPQPQPAPAPPPQPAPDPY